MRSRIQHKIIRVILSLLIISCGFIAWVKLAAFYQEFSCFAFDAPPVCVRSKIIGSPAVNHTIKLRTEMFAAVSRSSDAVLSISLPEQVKLISGDLFWQGTISEEQSIIHEIEIQVIEPGEWEIEIRGFLEEGGGADVQRLFLLSSRKSGQTSQNRTPNNWYPYATGGVAVSTDAGTVKSSLSFSDTPHLNEPLKVTYTITPTINITDARLSIIFPPHGFDIITINCTQGLTPSEDNHINHITYCIGNLEAEETVTMIVDVKIVETGQGSIYAGVHYSEKQGNNNYFYWSAGEKIMNLEVNKYGGSYSIQK